MNQSRPSGNNVLEANRLAGTRLELLLFHLEGPQTFGINVFKVQEVIPYQRLTHMVGAHPLVKGIATLRGVTMPIMDMSEAVGGPAMRDPQQGNIVITEYNRSVQRISCPGCSSHRQYAMGRGSPKAQHCR